MIFTISTWNSRLRASAIHLLISIGVALLSALLVFGVWYPYPYGDISGGKELFILLVTVDVILGPLITLTIFSPTKRWSELRRDLAIVAIIQISALSYGMWTVFVARPVHMVFEIYRFNVVHAIDIDEALLPFAPKGINALPATGPTLLALRPFKDEKERVDVTMAALQGASLASRPDLWRPYEEAAKDVLKEAKPAIQLLTRFEPQAAQITRKLKDLGYDPQNVVYLPMIGRKSFWTVFLDPVTAKVLTTMPLDSF